jgi:hypothetical protein
MLPAMASNGRFHGALVSGRSGGDCDARAAAGLGQAIFLDAVGVALDPFRRQGLRPEPVGAISTNTLSVWRKVSPTLSSRVSARAAASACVESVRCVPHGLS